MKIRAIPKRSPKKQPSTPKPLPSEEIKRVLTGESKGSGVTRPKEIFLVEGHTDATRSKKVKVR